MKRTLNLNKDQGKNKSYISFESISGVFLFFCYSEIRISNQNYILTDLLLQNVSVGVY